MIALGKETVDYHVLSKEVDFPVLLNEIFGITKIPCLIKSPLRDDKHPSFKIYSPDGVNLYFKDFSTGEHGGMLKFFSLYWGVSIPKAVEKLNKNLIETKDNSNKKTKKAVTVNHTLDSSKNIEVKVRNWKPYDKEYWKSYGVTIEALKKADVYPVSHRIIEKDGKTMAIPMDKLAYAYVERKDKKVTIKLYQPYNTRGYKWLGTHRGDVISLWSTLPEKGDKVCLCSSVKDALCLTCNTGIPAIALQGEGYVMSTTAQKNLKSRFKNVYILYDNDEAGLAYAEKISKETGFKNIILPRIEEEDTEENKNILEEDTEEEDIDSLIFKEFRKGKDISDFYKVVGKEKFIETITPLFNN